MFKTLKRWLGLTRYKIIQDNVYGYCALYRAEGGWLPLDANGTACDDDLFRDPWVPDIEQARARIDKHAINRIRKAIEDD